MSLICVSLQRLSAIMDAGSRYFLFIINNILNINNMKLNIPFLSWQKARLLIIGFLLLFFGVQCNSTRNSSLTEEPRMAEVDLEEYDWHTIIQTGKYYIGISGGKEYAVCFNYADKKELKGVFYEMSSTQDASPVSFTASLKKKKIVFSHQQQSTTWKDVVVHFSDTNITGQYEVDHETRSFSFHLYQEMPFEVYQSRYQNETFEYEVVKNIKYGKVTGYWTTNTSDSNDYFKIFTQGVASSIHTRDLDLTMDIYLPKNDTLSSRPLIMFIHGGAFYVGSKEDSPIVSWCRHFASLGYVVASINYRMGFLPTKAAIERCGYAATQDAHAAMRFLVHNKETYRINPDYLFVAGSSAGGITALNLTFMRNENRPKSALQKMGKQPPMGNIESSGNEFTETFHIRAVANMWGAVHDISMLNNSKTSIISFHGDADKIVPYNYDMPFQALKLGINKLFFDKMYGSLPIHKKARELGYREELNTFENASHAPHISGGKLTEKFWFIQDRLTDFLYREFVPKPFEITEIQNHWYVVEGAEKANLQWKVTGGLVMERRGNQVRVLWLHDADHRQLEVSGRLPNGASIYAKLEK